MGKMKKFSVEVKMEVVREYFNGLGQSELGRIFGCDISQIKKWINTYKAHGKDALNVSHKNQTYSEEFKLMVVKEYQRGDIGLNPLAIKYKIRSNTLIRNWIKRYNSHEGNLKAYRSNGGIRMTKGRKTTFEERIEIVEDCLKNGENYAMTAEKFKVSYNQIYSWVSKYNNQGITALKDNRGKGKAIEEMDKTELLEVENKLLRAKLARLEMEADLKKKLQEVQMRLEFSTRNKK